MVTRCFYCTCYGGIPKRLTWHPGGDLVRDFSPDGKKILFASQRNSFTNRYLQLFTVDVASGAEEQLQIPMLFGPLIVLMETALPIQRYLIVLSNGKITEVVPRVAFGFTILRVIKW
jgi:hypothetical protein